MTQILLQHANIVQFLVLLTFVLAIVNYRKTVLHKTLIAILCVSLSNEIITYYFLVNNGKSTIFYNINVLLHHGLWLFLFSQIARIKHVILCSLVGFVIFSTLNLTCLEGPKTFNSNTFILGAILYLSLFIFESFKRLEAEELTFFTNSYYILLCAPLLLFIALSFMMGFKSRTLYELKIYENITLYQAITHFANLVYYSLINIYILDKKKSENGI